LQSPTSPNSASSDDHPIVQQESLPLPPAELAEVRSMSQHSNYTSLSSAGSCEDIHTIHSPESFPLRNESHDPEVVNEFPSVGPPAGHIDTSMISASDIYVDANESSNIKSPTIFIDVFDTDGGIHNRHSVVSPTAELCTANDDDEMDDIVLDAGTNKIISKRESSTALVPETFPDIDILSQEILNEISMVGMSLNEEQFSALPDEYSPVTTRKQHSNLSSMDQVIFPLQQQTNQSNFNSSNAQQRQQYSGHDKNAHNGVDIFPSALVGQGMDGSHYSMEHTRGSSRHQYQNDHHQTHNMAISKVASDNQSQYHVHISPYASDSDSPKSTKRIVHSNSINTHPLHNSRESPKSERQKHYSSPPTIEHQWREVSPQYSDEPNEEFVLPPPPQFQGDNDTNTSTTTTYPSSTTTACVSEVDKSLKTSKLSSSLSASAFPSPSTDGHPRTLRSGKANYSTSHLMNKHNMNEEVLLTDMLKSLDKMAAEKYHEEIQQSTAVKDKQPYTPESKAEKSEKRKQKKKAMKRRSTVGIYNFDDLIKQSVQENRPVGAEEYPRQPANELKVSDDSKVKKLAREYSKRVKDRQVFNNIKKRFSVHSYENFSGSEPNTPESTPKDPSWKAVADSKRDVHRGRPLSPAAKRLPTIVSGSVVSGSSDISSRGSGVPDCTVVSNNYAAQSSPKFNKFRGSPVMVRSSSPVRLRIEGFEKLSQPRDDYPSQRKSEPAVPLQPVPTTRHKSRSNLSHVKSQENIAVINQQPNVSKQEKSKTAPSGTLGQQSRELSKSYGSLNPVSIGGNGSNSKSYRGLSVFSPDSLDESNIIYKPSGYREDFEHIRTKGGFKGWVKNLVDKFSK